MKLLQAKNISRSFPLGNNTVKAVEDVSLDIEQGEFVIVKGASGSGKSTLLNILGLMDEPNDGVIQLHGHCFTGLSEKQKSLLRRKHIGFVFQSFNLIPVLTALENVMYPLTLQKASDAKEKAIAALTKVQLGDFLHQRPNQLSGGQMQRVAIARALVTEPDIILADEPTANLDSKTAASVMELMMQLNQEQQMTFLIASHHEYLFDLASRVIEMQDGKIIADRQIHKLQKTELPSESRDSAAESGSGSNSGANLDIAEVAS